MKTFITIILAITFLMTTGCAVAGPVKHETAKAPEQKSESGQTIQGLIDGLKNDMKTAIVAVDELPISKAYFKERNATKEWKRYVELVNRYNALVKAVRAHEGE